MQMRRIKVLLFLTLCGAISVVHSHYNGRPQVACNGCSSSAGSIASFARDQINWLGWSGAADMYVLDTSNQARFRINMAVTFEDGTSEKDLDLWKLFLRTIQGTADPNRLKIEVFNSNGQRIGEIQFLLSSIIDNVYGEPWELAGYDRVSDFATNLVAINTVYSNTSTYLGSTRTPVTGVEECYGECEVTGGF